MDIIYLLSCTIHVIFYWPVRFFTFLHHVWHLSINSRTSPWYLPVSAWSSVSSKGVVISLFITPSLKALRAHPAFYSRVSGILSSGLKRLEREADHSLPSVTWPITHASEPLIRLPFVVIRYRVASSVPFHAKIKVTFSRTSSIPY
jgi:hypothetical protein